MKAGRWEELCLVAFAGVLASCASTSSKSQVISSGTDTSLSGWVFSEVNAYRNSKGKASLQRHPGLDRLAQEHCDYLVKNGGNYGIYGKGISHFGFDARAVAAKHAYKITSLGENVASSTNHSAKHFVEIWAASKDHQQNMVADWNCAGVATAVTPDGKVIATQIFGTAPSTSQLTMKQRFNREW